MKRASQFDRTVRQMDKRLERLFKQLSSVSLPGAQRHLVEQSVTELSTAMEELHVAQEELQVQNEQLIAARLEVEQEQQRYKDLFDSAPDGYLVTTPDGVVEQANRAAVSMLDWSAKALRGKPLASLVAKEHCERLSEGLAVLTTMGTARQMQWRMRPRQKPEFEAQLTASLVRARDGSVTSIRWLIRDATRDRTAAEQLMEYQRRLRSLAAELSIAEERERRQIAIEIHDRISQNLVIAKLKLATAQQHFSRESGVSASLEFREALTLLEQAMNDTRTLTFELSPPILHELGLLPALQWLGEELGRQHGLRVVVDGVADQECSGEDLRSFLFRSVRELLLNVVKHAQATAARISVRTAEDRLRITVADDGAGISNIHEVIDNAMHGGFGLFSMRTRLEEMGGKFEISSVPGMGTRVTLLAPVGTSHSGGGQDHGHENPSG